MPPQYETCPQDKVDRVMGYTGFVDFVTVVQEHVIGLRSWDQRTPSATNRPDADNAGTGMTSADNEPPATSPWRGRLEGGGGKQRQREENSATSGGIEEGQRAADQEAKPPGKEENEEIESGSKAERHLSLNCRPSQGKLDTATPWLSWDFAASGGINEKGAKYGSCAAAAAAAGATATAPTSAFGGYARNEHDSKDEGKDGEYDHKDEGDDGKSNSKWREEEEKEEPKVNRSYGTQSDGRGVSVNQLIAFQTDRVVRMLDSMF